MEGSEHVQTDCSCTIQGKALLSCEVHAHASDLHPEATRELVAFGTAADSAIVRAQLRIGSS
jgi:hypothetical protein